MCTRARGTNDMYHLNQHPMINKLHLNKGKSNKKNAHLE